MLGAVARFHRPAETPAPVRQPPPREVVYLDFPSLSAPSGAGGASFPAAAPAALSRAPAATSLAVAAAEAPPVVASPPPAASPRLGAGFRDARLYVDPGALVPAPSPRPAAERLVSDARAAILREPDSVAARRARGLVSRQVTIMGRRVTVLGDSAAAGVRTAEIELRPDIQTLPVDGRTWERLEMSRQDDAFVRDSILRARARATRERVDVARRAGQPRP